MRTLRLAGLVVLLSSVLLAVGLVPRPALAIDAEVSGSICTRDDVATAIDDASGGGTVTFDCDTPTITFAGGDRITISDTVTIDGSNSGNSIILDANHTTNFFNVTDDGDLTVIHLTLREGGNVGVEEGGAIDLDDDGTLTVIGVTFIDNQAQYGGAIDQGDGTLTISQSSFAHNQAADYGGAIWNHGDLTISQSSFTGNHANDHGGAIDLNDSSAAITASTFSGNTANIRGSTLFVHAGVTSVNVSWSTIVQPAGEDTPAFFLSGPLTLAGVLLAGNGNHCAFDTGSLTTSSTLSNDDSCVQGSTVDWENETLLLGPRSAAIIDGVEQSYYPLLTNSPAIDGGPATCDTDILEGTDLDQLGTPRPVGDACDIGAIEWLEPTALCANQWNGQLSMASGHDCGRSETLIQLPADAPLDLCVNNWNGTARAGDDCSRSEHPIIVTGNHSIPICVNRWNDAIRVNDHCSRSEHADLL